MKLSASSLGVNVPRVRAIVDCGVAIGIGSAVAVSGACSFIGLVAPHLHVIAPMASIQRASCLPSALAGAALLLAADIIIRVTGGPNEIRIGVITALIGAPFFIFMIFKERYALEDAAS